MKQLIVLFCLVAAALGSRICQDDTDCADLGELECIKSACNWGICGCPRDYVTRFVGSEKLFKCVKLKKIGEKCSTDGISEGICGAANSDCVVCDQCTTDGSSVGKCECDSSYEARWGGEECLSTKTPYPTETCSASLGAACGGGATCASSGAWYGSFSGALTASLQNAPYDDTPNTCACASGYRTVLNNAFYSASFVGGSAPNCEKIAVGDLCFLDSDCGEIYGPDGSGGWSTTGANCTNNVCTCGAGLVPDMTGLYCATAISYGQTCMTSNTQVNSSVGVCNGDEGLRCGSPCDLTTYLDTGDYTCQCDPAYTDNSGTCTANLEGDTCYGDLNCKGIGSRAVCTDGLCSSGAGKWLASSLLLTVGLLLSLRS